MPLFFGDFIASTAEWSGEDRALYLLLLGYQWTLGSLPEQPVHLSRLVSWNHKRFLASWKTVKTKFVLVNGRLINRRLEDHRAHATEISNKRAAAGRLGAEATNSKRRGKISANAAANAATNAAEIPANAAANGAAHAGILPRHPSNPIHISKSLTHTQDSNSVAAGARAGEAGPSRAPAPLSKRTEDPLDERRRKARVLIQVQPTIEPEKVARMFKLELSDVLAIKQELAAQQAGAAPC